jgi:translation initiation factor 4E
MKMLSVHQEFTLGIVLSKRMKRNLLELWITDRSNEEAKIHIGESLRVILGMNPDKLTFYFKDHNKSLKV